MGGSRTANGIGSMIVVTLRVLQAAVFLYAGFAKIGDPVGLSEDILQYQLLQDSTVNIFALALPPFEILSAMALLIGPWKRQAAFSLAFLCTIFLIGLGYAAFRGLSIECHCFGAASGTTMGIAAFRDVFLLIVAIAVYWRERRR